MNQIADPDKLVHVITDSAHRIWLAGLGALSLAEKEGGKFFETLSRLGENIQSHTLKTAGLAKKTVIGSKATATGTWDKFEELFELRVGRALNALQIPTARDIHELTKRVNRLSKAVDQLGSKETAGDKSTAGKSTAGKSTAGKSAAGKSAAGKSAAGKSAAGKSAAGKSAARKSAAVAGKTASAKKKAGKRKKKVSKTTANQLKGKTVGSGTRKKRSKV